MRADQTCATCACFAFTSRECRENAPQPVVMPAPSGEVTIMGVFPASTPERWCGRWRDLKG